MSRPCKCYGSNENCYYCGGTGIIADNDLGEQIKTDFTLLPTNKTVANLSSSKHCRKETIERRGRTEKTQFIKFPDFVECKVCKIKIPNNQLDVTMHSITFHKNGNLMQCPYCGREVHYNTFDVHIIISHNGSHQELAKNLLRVNYKKIKQTHRKLENAINAYKVRQANFDKKIGVPKRAELLTEEDKFKNLRAHGNKLVKCNICSVKVLSKYYLKHIHHECLKPESVTVIC